MLRLDDRWIWDFWLARDGDDHHVFFLQAPRSLGDPELRHSNASIGHAVSSDLRSWAVLPDVLGPGAPGAWDDRIPWTGSVVRHEDRWYLFYTSTSTAERGLVQRIGAATSDDLITWHRHPSNPLMSADARWYERLDASARIDEAWFDEAWRDPWVMRPHGSNAHLALITARTNTGAPDGRGAIAVARSVDLVHWDIGPPVYAPGEFGELEVPQVVEVADRWYLIFSVPGQSHGRSWRERTRQPPRHTVYHVTGDGPTGPFHGPPQRLVIDADDGELFAGKLVADGVGRWWFMAARFGPAGGEFIGELTDPMPVEARSDGRLVVEQTAVRRRTGQ